MERAFTRPPTASPLSTLVVVLALAILVSAGLVLYRDYLNNQTTNNTLIIHVPNGSGSSIPNAGIHSFNQGELVNITAYPNPGWRFDHWVQDGGKDVFINPLTLLMNSNHTLEAVFVQIQYMLNVSTSGLGSVAKSPDQTSYASGSTVRLTATSTSGWSFSGWSGDLSGSANPTTVTMDSAKSVTATFIFSPLHVEGKLIKDSSGNTVILRGINLGLSFCENNPGSYWMGVAGWNPTHASQELDIIKSWGCNIVRIHECYEYWIQNTVDPVSGLTHRQIVYDLASMCAQKGLYFFIDGYCVTPYGANGHQQTPLPFPPDENSYELAVIPNAQTWINMWSSAATALSDLPNVIIEPHNEPVPASGQDWTTQRTLWFTNLQSCVTAIRATGFSGLIAYQWDYSTSVNLDYPTYNPMTLGINGTLYWVLQYPISDPTGNLVVSTHQYWDGGELGMWSVSHGAPPNVYPSAYSDILHGITDEGLPYILNTLNKPVIIGEFGADVVWSNQTLMQTAFTNQLQVYNDLGISYCAFWFRSSGVYALTTSDGSPAPNTYGTILRNKIVGR